MTMRNSKWVVLFTRERFYENSWANPYELQGHLHDKDTQAFFVGTLAEALAFCKKYAAHEVGWERCKSLYETLAHEYRAPAYIKCRECSNEILSLDMLPEL